jgi:hypothetical protein
MRITVEARSKNWTLRTETFDSEFSAGEGILYWIEQAVGGKLAGDQFTLSVDTEDDDPRNGGLSNDD